MPIEELDIRATENGDFVVVAIDEQGNESRAGLDVGVLRPNQVGTPDDPVSEQHSDSVSTEEANITNRVIFAWFGSGNTVSSYDIANYSDVGAAVNQILTDAGTDKVSIQLPAGDLTWSTATTILNDGRTIAGMGHGQTTIRSSDVSSDWLTVGDADNRASNIQLKDFRIDGQESGNNPNDCIVLKRFRNVHIDNVYQQGHKKGLVLTNELAVGSNEQIDAMFSKLVVEDNTEEGIHLDGATGTGKIKRIQFNQGYSFGNRRALLAEGEVENLQVTNYELSSSEKENIKLSGANCTNNRFVAIKAENANQNADGSYIVNLDSSANDNQFLAWHFDAANGTNGVRIDGNRNKFHVGILDVGSFDFASSFEGATEIRAVSGFRNVNRGQFTIGGDGATQTIPMDDTPAVGQATCLTEGVYAQITGFDTNDDAVVALKNISDGSANSDFNEVFLSVYGETATFVGNS